MSGDAGLSPTPTAAQISLTLCWRERFHGRNRRLKTLVWPALQVSVCPCRGLRSRSINAARNRPINDCRRNWQRILDKNFEQNSTQKTRCRRHRPWLRTALDDCSVYKSDQGRFVQLISVPKIPLLGVAARQLLSNQSAWQSRDRREHFLIICGENWLTQRTYPIESER